VIATTPTHDAVRNALRQVIDPEVGVDIVSLGLVYDVAADGGDVTVTFTLTTPRCPLNGIIQSGLVAAVYALPGVENVNANLVWEPRWHPGLIEEGVL
jgi:metal-sulfur cluster biosynthetic enzyme